MKKLKIVCFTLMSIFLLVFGVFSFGVKVKAANYDWWGAPESAKNFVDFDGKGIRLYFLEVWFDANDVFECANLVPIKEYQLEDGLLETGADSVYGSVYFEPYLLQYVIPRYYNRWGSGETIPEWDRTYVYWDVEDQWFAFEFQGSGVDYAAFCIEEYYYNGQEAGYEWGYDVGFDLGYEIGREDEYPSAYNYGYNDGYDVGYDEGYIEGIDLGYQEGYYEGYINGLYISECGPIYEQGFKDGQESKLAENNASFYQGIEKWLVPAIIAVIALGGFVTIAVNKRREG